MPPEAASAHISSPDGQKLTSQTRTGSSPPPPPGPAAPAESPQSLTALEAILGRLRVSAESRDKSGSVRELDRAFRELDSLAQTDPSSHGRILQRLETERSPDVMYYLASSLDCAEDPGIVARLVWLAEQSPNDDLRAACVSGIPRLDEARSDVLDMLSRTVRARGPDRVVSAALSAFWKIRDWPAGARTAISALALDRSASPGVRTAAWSALRTRELPAEELPDVLRVAADPQENRFVRRSALAVAARQGGSEGRQFVERLASGLQAEAVAQDAQAVLRQLGHRQGSGDR